MQRITQKKDQIYFILYTLEYAPLAKKLKVYLEIVLLISLTMVPILFTETPRTAGMHSILKQFSLRILLLCG